MTAPRWQPEPPTLPPLGPVPWLIAVALIAAGRSLVRAVKNGEQR